MPLTEEERKKYVDYINGQVTALNCLKVEDDDIIWHYTTGNSLLSIVESGSIYATQVLSLNDSSEVRYGQHLIRDAFLTVRSAEDSLPPVEAEFLERLIKNSVELDAPNRPSDWFVTCFSREKDDLSQWRAYGGGENGFAIAFRAKLLFHPENLLVRVNYSKEQHLAVCTNLAKATLDFFREGLAARTEQKDRDSWPDEFLQEWDRWLQQLAPMVKDPAFKTENEYRIIHRFNGYEMAKLRFRQKQSLMSLHLPLLFPPPASATSHSNMLPIQEIMVGPSRHKEVSRVSVELFMRQKGYFAVPVTVSTIPFQLS